MTHGHGREQELSIGLVSGGDEIRFRSYVNHLIYAREHGLDYRLEIGLDEGIDNPFLYSTAIIRRLLEHYDWLVWIDDDAYFTDFDSDGIRRLAQDAEQDGKFLVIAEGPEEPNGFWSRINTGVFLLRRGDDANRLLRLMEDAELDAVREWWDPQRDGLFTGGDQDQMWWALFTTDLLERTQIVGHRALNSRGDYYEDSLSDALVMHFCGHGDKPLGVVRFAERFGVGEELVPEHLLDRYSVRVRSPMTRPERLARAARARAWSRAKRTVRPLLERVPAAEAPLRRLVGR